MGKIEFRSTLESFKKYTNLKVLFFFEYASLACWQPYMGVFLHELQLKPSIIGIITCLIPSLMFISAPIYTYVADRYSIEKKVLMLNCVLSMFALLALIPIGKNLIGIFIFISFYSLVSAPIYPIVDSLVLKEMGEDSKLYGQQRLFAAIGWGLVAFSTGIIIEYLPIHFILVLYSFWMVIFVLYYIFNQTHYSTKIKNSFKKLSLNKSNDGDDVCDSQVTKGGDEDEECDIISIKKVSIKISSNDIIELKDEQGEECDNIILSSSLSSEKNNGNEEDDCLTKGECEDEIPKDLEIVEAKMTKKQVLVNLIRNTQFMIFLFSIMICGMAFNIINSFLFIYLQDHKQASKIMMGTIMPFQVSFELPFFFFGKVLLDKVGITKMIIIGHIAYLIRLVLYNILSIDSVSPWCVLPIETMHGITFATLWSAGIELSSLMAPRGFETTYQGIFNGVFSGLGASIGSIIGGFLYEHTSPMFLFRFTAIAIFTSLSVFSLSRYYYSKTKQSNFRKNTASVSHF